MSHLAMLLDRIPVRLRLSLVHAVWMAVIYVAIGFGLYKVVENNLNDSINAALISSAKSIRDARFSWSRHPSAEALIDQFFHDPLPLQPFMGARLIKPYARIMSISGKVHSKSDDNVLAALPVTPKAIARAERGLSTLETFVIADNPPLRQITLPVMLHDKFTGDMVQVGVFLNHMLDTLQATALLLGFVLPLTLLISIILGYLLMAGALKPVNAITQAAAPMGIDELSNRLPVPIAKDEIQQLAQTFNGMFDRLEDAVKRLRRFTADVSHELRTPLAVLRGEAELALRRKRSPDEYERALQTIRKEAQHMTTIIEDLLLLARVESKSVALNWVLVRTENFMRELEDQVAVIFRQRQVSLAMHAQGLESFSCASSYLALALKNILLNAAKHSAPHSMVTFSICKTKTGGQESVSFEISDEGEGIPPEALPNIFDPFYRADTARNRASGGVGIGLSLALALVKLQHGTIAVRSQLGQGTTFTAQIPYRKE